MDEKIKDIEITENSSMEESTNVVNNESDIVGIVSDSSEVDNSNEIPEGYVEVDEVERPDTVEESSNEKEVSESPEEENKTDEEKKDDEKELPIYQLHNFLKMAGDTIRQMEAKWRMIQSELRLTQPIIKKIYDYNMEHAIPLPEEATAEAHVQYDHFNGLDNITLEELKELLGEEHQLTKGDLKENVTDLKNAMGLFMSWLTSIREYKEAYKNYEDILDAEQFKNVEVLKNLLETEEDPEKREKMQAALNDYYDKLYLNFLAIPMSEEDVDRLVNVFVSPEKFSYWEARAADKLKQIGVAPLTIVEMAQFEKKFLEEKYYKCSNMIALYIMHIARFARNDDNSINNTKRKILIITSTLHKIIDGSMQDDQKQKVLDNIRAFLDQFLDKDILNHTELFENFAKKN